MMKKGTNLYLAVSIAATWAWGHSLLTGMNVVNNKGIFPFAIWGTMNALALWFFGGFIKRYPRMFELQNHKAILSFTTLVRVFSCWIQMSAMYETLLATGYGEVAGQVGAYIVGAILILLMYFTGLRGSIFTDQFQWYLMQGCIIIITMFGIGLNTYKGHELVLGINQVPWAIWGGILLMGGPFVDLSNIQRAKIVHEKKLNKAYLYAFIVFFIYQAGIFIMSLFGFSKIMNIIYLVCVGLLAASTMDSDAVALHQIAGRNKGLLIGLTTVATWQFVKVIGFFNLWQIIANIRIYVAVFIMSLTIYRTKKGKAKAGVF